MKPKQIIGDANSLVSKCHHVILKYRHIFKKIYSIGRTVTAWGQQGRNMDIKSFIDIMVVRNQP
jgi:hypothetical protein